MKTFTNQTELIDALIGAVITWNSDPFLIETEEIAEQVAENIMDSLVEVVDADELEDAKAKLDLSDNQVSHIYSFDGGIVCFAGDWE